MKIVWRVASIVCKRMRPSGEEKKRRCGRIMRNAALQLAAIRQEREGGSMSLGTLRVLEIIW